MIFTVFSCSTDKVKLEIYVTANLHGKLDSYIAEQGFKPGLINIAALLRSRQQGSLLLDLGSWERPFVDPLLNEKMHKALKSLNYDIIALGKNAFIENLTEDSVKEAVYTSHNVSFASQSITNELTVLYKEALKIHVLSFMEENIHKELPQIYQPNSISYSSVIEIYNQKAEEFHQADFSILLFYGKFDTLKAFVDEGLQADIILLANEAKLLNETYNSIPIVSPGGLANYVAHIVISKEDNMQEFDIRFFAFEDQQNFTDPSIQTLIHEYHQETIKRSKQF